MDHPALCRGEIYGLNNEAYHDNWFRSSLLVRSAIAIALHYSWQKDQKKSFLVT